MSLIKQLWIAIILVAVFFVTSSDSGSLVVDMLASGGHPNPPMWSRVLWALLEGLLAAALLFVKRRKARASEKPRHPEQAPETD